MTRCLVGQFVGRSVCRSVHTIIGWCVIIYLKSELLILFTRTFSYILLHQTYSNCLCIPGDHTSPRSNGSAKPGYCDRKCKNEILFAVISSLTLVLHFSTAVPGRTVILR